MLCNWRVFVLGRLLSNVNRNHDCNHYSQEDIHQSTSLSARPEFDTFGRLGGTATRKQQQQQQQLAVAGGGAGAGGSTVAGAGGSAGIGTGFSTQGLDFGLGQSAQVLDTLVVAQASCHKFMQ
jgi:hypothetical protein